MLLGIDHLVIAVDDPDAAATELARVAGLRSAAGGRHEALGTLNRLVWLGDAYLELVGIFDRERASGSWIGAPALRALETGGGLAAWAVATDSIERDVEQAGHRGFALLGPTAGERRRPDGRLVRWRLAVGGSLDPAGPPFLIEHDLAAAEWSAAERAARAGERHPIGGPVRLAGLELAVADPARLARLVEAELGLPFREAGDAYETGIGAQRLRLPQLRPGGDGVVGPKAGARPVVRLDVAGLRDARTVDVLGCRLEMRSVSEV